MCSHVARQRFERTSDGAIALALRVPLLNSHAAGPPNRYVSGNEPECDARLFLHRGILRRTARFLVYAQAPSTPLG